jgi:PBP1b-binding outer membrane lipoprotein LpoB
MKNKGYLFIAILAAALLLAAFLAGCSQDAPVNTKPNDKYHIKM